MRIARNFTLSALAVALAVLAPITVRAQQLNTISIDESVEGATPTVTSTLSGSVFSVIVTPVAGVAGQEWTIVIHLAGGATFGATNNGGNLLEPSELVSDALVLQSESAGGNGADFQYLLFSDDNLGNILGACTTNPSTGVVCTNQPENDAFQHVTDVSTDVVGPVQILLRSDPDPVPEPGTIGLVLVGLVAVALERLRKRRLAL